MWVDTGNVYGKGDNESRRVGKVDAVVGTRGFWVDSLAPYILFSFVGLDSILDDFFFFHSLWMAVFRVDSVDIAWL